jgi:glycosyltransferase involved in cell wall biosynthesis/aminoglycoside phosphotransferase (APT) family kinase protein
MHEEARPWIARALYVPFLSAGVIAANLRALGRRPGAMARAFGDIAGGSLLSPHTLVRSLMLFPEAVALAERLERAGVRHLHAHYATHPATVALVISRLTGIRFSFTAHAHDIFVRRVLLGTKIREAAFVRAISRFNRDFLLDRYPDVAPEKIAVVHVGVDPARYEAAAADRAASAAARASAPTALVAVAALRPYKGLSVLLDACARLAHEGVAFTCQIIGEGPERQALATRIAELGLGDTVTLLGARRQDQVASCLAGASVIVLPSVVARDGQMEGIPVALMEAMSAGVPVVASSLSGIPELVRDGETGWLVTPGDPEALAHAIQDLIRSPERAAAMSWRGREAVRSHFSLDRCTAALIDRIDACAPPPDDAIDLPLSAVMQGRPVGPIGLRAVLDRRDSRVARLLVPNGAAPHELVVKIHRSRPGESRPAAERARREFAFLQRLDEAAGRGCRVPRPRALDEAAACLVMDACGGTPLDDLIRRARFTRDPADRAALRVALIRTGRWLRAFQHETVADENPARVLDALAARTAARLGANEGLIPAYSSRRVRAQLDALRTRLAPASLRVTASHGDFSPGNVFADAEGVAVIDFEGCDAGLPYEDVADFLIQLELFFPGSALRHRAIELATDFLDGYLSRPAATTSFDWAAYELCRISSAVRLLSSDRAADRRGLRALRRRRALRAMVAGGVV